MMKNFFFQAEDGIRGYKVTGVQTCALPILGGGGQQAVGGKPDIGFALIAKFRWHGVQREQGALDEIGRASCREGVYILMFVVSYTHFRNVVSESYSSIMQCIQ